jgi:[amino group carrier protein]-L-2-aminoadipate 6-kinase
MIIVKIGGGSSINLDAIARDLAALAGPFVVVHGANAARDALAAALGRDTTVVTALSGYDSVLSDDAAIELLFMAYAGLRNKQVVEALQRAGVDAIGLSGIDGRVVQGRRTGGFRVRDGERVRIVRDRSGKPVSINRSLLETLLAGGYTPVLTVPIADESGAAINSENDDVVALLQRELGAEAVVQLIEAPGVLRDPADPASLVHRLSASELVAWEAAATGRFKRKLLALRRLLEAGAPAIVVADGRGEHPVAGALAGAGTTIVADAARRAVGE